MYGLSHDHSGGSIHDHCSFPSGVVDIYDTVYLTLLGINYNDEYVDVGIKSSNEDITAYEFNVSGLSILNVDNMIDPNIYPIQPDFSIGGQKIIGISYEDSVINRMNNYQHLCRINYFDLDGNDICLDTIIDIVNVNHHTTTTIIENGCLNVASNYSHENSESYFKIIPNPSKDFVSINYELAYKDQLVVQLQNSIGEVVYLSKITSAKQGNFKLDIVNYPMGVYMVSLKTSNGLQTLKLIKN